ncbi:MAG TPA: AI-2E family transporter [Methanomicrobia archaeon]|nr:AI-2E family transporter [Methanomicrobia archaeon]
MKRVTRKDLKIEEDLVQQEQAPLKQEERNLTMKMQQPHESKNKLNWQILGVISVALLAYMFFPFIDVIIYGIFIYYVARPAYRELDNRFKHKNLDAFISLFLVVLPIVLISIYTADIAYTELKNILTQEDSAYLGYASEIFKDIAGIAAYLELADITTSISQGDTWGFIITLLTQFVGIISAFFNIFFKLFLTFTIAFYLLKDGAKLREWLTDTFLGGNTEITQKFFDELDSGLHTVFFGNILTAIVTALIGAVAFTLLNLVAPPRLMIPYPILLAILCSICTFIPLIGMKLVYIPLAGYLVMQAYINGILFTHWWFLLLFILVVSVVVDFIPDTILRPFISRKSLHSGTLLLAYIFGIAVFGFVGLFLGPIILITATQFLKIVQPALVVRVEARKKEPGKEVNGPGE